MLNPLGALVNIDETIKVSERSYLFITLECPRCGGSVYQGGKPRSFAGLGFNTDANGNAQTSKGDPLICLCGLVFVLRVGFEVAAPVEAANA